MNITYSVINGTATTQAPIVTINTPQETNLELTVVPSVEDGKSVYEGSTLTYNVTVKSKNIIIFFLLTRILGGKTYEKSYI